MEAKHIRNAVLIFLGGAGVLGAVAYIATITR